MSGFIINPFVSFGASASYPGDPGDGENLDAETGDTTGWTASTGSMSASTSEAESGTYSFYGDDGALLAYYDIQIDSSYYTDIDAGDAQLTVEAGLHCQDLNTGHNAHVWADFYDGDPGSGGTLKGSGEQTLRDRSYLYNGWRQCSNGYVAIPADTDWLRVYLYATADKWFFDNITIGIHKKESVAVTITDAGFESGVPTSWVSLYQVDDGTVHTTITGKVGTEFGSDRVFSSGTATMYQDITLPTTSGWDDTIDDGDATFVLDWLTASTGNYLTGTEVDVNFYSGSPTTGYISDETIIRSFNGDSNQPEFQRRFGQPIAVPATARYIRCSFLTKASGGGIYNHTMLDDINMNLWRPV